MKKILIVILLIATCNVAFAYGGYGKKKAPYSIALHLSNPLGLMSKYGAGIEYRFHGTSLLYDYYKYNAVFPGRQQSLELQFFLRSRNRHEFYLYAKGLIGDASYNGNQLNFLKYNTDIALPDMDYLGGGAGIGRRFNFNHFFVSLSGGFKACVFTDNNLTTDQKHIYNLFYATGPGAIVDLHLQFGFQF